MLLACSHAHSMPKMIQIRNVPDQLHRRLKARAAEEGVTLSELLLAELRQLADRPSWRAFLAERARPVRPDLEPSPAALVRADRDRR
jgi:plasmid stability protein